MRLPDILLFYLLLLSISLGIIYTPVTKVDLQDPSLGDIHYYIAIYEGKSLKEIPKPFRYRFIVPVVARVIPSLPNIIADHFDIDSTKIIKYKFGLLNAVGMSLAAFVLFLFCGNLGFSKLLSLVGSLLFLTNFYIINYAGLPMVDAFAYFFLIICFYAIMKDRNLLLFTMFTLGIFVKETIVLSFAYILCQKRLWSQKVTKILICMPGVSAYLYVRLIMLPTQQGYNYTIDRFIEANAGYLQSVSPWVNAFINMLFGFGFLWLLSVKGWLVLNKQKHPEISAMMPILPVVLALPIIIGSNLGRIWFLAFPLILPLALKGLESYLSEKST